MKAAGRLSPAGFSATAVTFGPARNGYGLFLPDIREEFGLSTEVLGFVASGLYAGYLTALLAVGLLAARTGPRLPVLAGLLSAGVGTALVALSPNPSSPPASSWPERARAGRGRRTTTPSGGRCPRLRGTGSSRS